MDDWQDLLRWIPIITCGVAGYYWGKYYSYYRYTRMCLGGLLFVLWKLHKRGETIFTPYDEAIIKMAVAHMERTER